MFGFAVGIVLSFLAASLAAATVGYRLGAPGPVPLAVTAADLVGLWAGLVGAAVWWSRVRGTGRLGADLGYRIGAWWDVPAGVLLGLACQFGLVQLLYLPFEHLDRHLADKLEAPIRQQTGAVHTGAAAAGVLILLAVGAPLVEELFFRGLLLRSLAGWLGWLPAVLLSGVVFGLAHFEALQLAGLVAFGIVLGLVAWRLGRVGPTVAAHLSFNAAAVLSTLHLH